MRIKTNNELPSIKADDCVKLADMKTGQFLVNPIPSPVQDLKWMLRKPDAPVTVEMMNFATVAYAARSQ